MSLLEMIKNTAVPRSIQTHAGSYFKLHGFSYASSKGLYAAIYVIQYINANPVSQDFFNAKSRIAPKGKSIPKLQFTAALVLVKLQSSILGSLQNYQIKSCHHWVDSTTVLYWLLTKVSWTVYVRNRVKRIEALSNGD